MTNYAVSQDNSESNLTLLCGTHHDATTRGWLGEDEIRGSNDEPFNQKQGHTTPWGTGLRGPVAETQVVLGTTVFSWPGEPFFPLIVDGVPIIVVGEQDGRPSLSAQFLDEMNQPALLILQNEIILSTEGWDIASEGMAFIIRCELRKIFLDIDFSQPNVVHIARGRLLCNGVEILLSKKEAKINGANVGFGESHIVMPCGLLVGHNPGNVNAWMLVDNVPRYGDRT
ncbi:hypothetical protein [Jiangella muralis]|uniref:hypothetical protein n=1 Tax=Jiangella muralis TaxID=702383 RepID=UPI00069EDAF1|nr:hypothetical protein [Jiangella muralis]